ncbi:hypothetical protein L9W92_05015 [Pelotomaculum terephthalicicum JT]|nr:hypothetical protein [Pelotomaculum terephthalicicum]MCG9967415.1 hypothetical protein [Pelotomaculum terephthalicicum JT]
MRISQISLNVQVLVFDAYFSTFVRVCYDSAFEQFNLKLFPLGTDI